MFHLMLLLSFLMAPAAWPRPMDRGPVRTPPHRLDIANPQDENIVLRNGVIAFNFTNYGYFGNDGRGQSSAFDDPCSGDWAPQFEYPEGSGAQYLFMGALWIGALIEEDSFFTTRVSVGTDGWQNPSINELHAGEAPGHGIILRSNLADATDCFGNNIYDPIARSNIEAEAVYSDTLSDEVLVRHDPIDGPHRPLGLQVTQTARLWTSPEFARLAILEFEIENIGENFLKDVSLGLYMDADIGYSGEVNQHRDDISGSLVIDPLIGNLIAWSADNDGRRYNDPNGPIVLPDAIGVAPLSEADSLDGGNFVNSFNWWLPNINPDFDYGPAWSDDPNWDCIYGYPEGDGRRYHNLRNRERDYDSYVQTQPSAQADTSFWCSSDGELHEWCEVETFFEQSDTRFMLSWDKISIFDFVQGDGRCVYRLNPGERFNFSAVVFIGPDFHTENSDEFNTEGLHETYNQAKYLFDQQYSFQPPTPVTNLQPTIASSGQIPVSWDAPQVGGIAGYRVFGRSDSGRGERIEFTTDLITGEEYTITGLTNGDYWLIEVQTEDNLHYHSAMAQKMVRVGAIPMNLDLQGVTDAGANTLSWSAVADPTFTHFKLVRVDSTVQMEYDNLTGTAYPDADVISGRMYTYVLHVQNNLGIWSLPSDSVTLIPFAPSAMILVYDETKTPTGPDPLRGSIADTLVRDWYVQLLGSLDEEFEYRDLANDAPELTLEALAGYELVIWHSENPKLTPGYHDERNLALRQYVNLGGKLLCFGRNSLLARGMITGTGWGSIPYYLSALQPLTFDSVLASPMYNPQTPTYNTRAIAATSVDTNFPSFEFDPVKLALPNYLGQTGFDFLPGVDYFWRNGNTWNLYTIVLQQEDTSGFNNAPCAVIGPGVIYFGFPLYFVPETQAEEILSASLHALRTQILDVPKPLVEPLPTKISLHQNYPNPFNATTTIEFELPAVQNVALRVFNIQGQMVSTLMEGKLAAGRHQIQFDASGLASGLYFCRLEVGSTGVTKKMLLLK